MNLTLKLKIEKDPDLLLTLKTYTSVMNYVSEAGFNAKDKMSNAVKLHTKFYYEIRDKFKLPSQLTCSALRDVASMYRSVILKHNKPAEKPIIFKESHYNCLYKRDFNLSGNLLNIRTLGGRKDFVLHISKYHQSLIERSVEFKGSSIVLDKKNRLFFCLVVDIPQDTKRESEYTMGIDVGMSKIATAFCNNGRTLTVSGGKIKDKRRKYHSLRKRLQHKGTWSAKRLLRRLAGKETRYVRDVNFCTVKKMICFAKANNVSMIGVENLSGIRNSKGRKQYKRMINTWAFSQFRFILEYKARLSGIGVNIFDPSYTSQACSKCGFTDKSNRKTQRHFLCQSCGFSHNADINAASNIELLTRLSRCNLEDRGAVNHPDATDVDAKTLFSGLRRSLVAILK